MGIFYILVLSPDLPLPAPGSSPILMKSGIKKNNLKENSFVTQEGKDYIAILDCFLSGIAVQFTHHTASLSVFLQIWGVECHLLAGLCTHHDG